MSDLDDLVGVPAGLEDFENDDAGEFDEATGGKNAHYVHIRIQQRNGRKSLTTIAGLDQKLDFPKVLKVVKKTFCCNGTVINDKDAGKVLQLQGDQRQNMFDFLSSESIVKKSQIKLHGF